MFKNGIFHKEILIPKDDKVLDPSFFEINLGFLFPHTEQLDLICNLRFFGLIILAFLFPVFFFTTYTISLHVYFLQLQWLENKMLKK